MHSELLWGLDNLWHVIFGAWTRDIGCIARELDWELVTSKITGVMSPLEEFFHLFICFLHIFGPRLLT